MLRPLMLIGTRPEAIKMAPLVLEARRRPGCVEPVVCFSGQHRELLQPITRHFGIEPDHDLGLMRPGQTLGELTGRAIAAIDDLIGRTRPDCVVAQGDTSTVVSAALAAFYRKLPFVHVEAGLRTGNLDAPWPEELHRRIAGLVARLHCAPTERAARALLAEGCSGDDVRVTGNTVIDALVWTLAAEQANPGPWSQKYRALDGRPLVLITGHRRENFGAGLRNICDALLELASQFPDVAFFYPVHANPEVRAQVERLLGKRSNVELLPPLVYPEFLWLLNRSSLVLTDSGGVQEEAPALGKPVLVMRGCTERPESVEGGEARLVGTNAAAIVAAAAPILASARVPTQTLRPASPYGDGRAAVRILDWMLERVPGRAPC